MTQVKYFGVKHVVKTRQKPPNLGNTHAALVRSGAFQRIVGIENWAPSLMPLGQRAVTVLVLV